MKKVLLVLCFLVVSTFAYAVNPIEREIPAKDKKETAKNDEKKKETSQTTEDCEEMSEEFCRISCSIEIDGKIYTATAGNFLSSCESAGIKCLDRLISQFLAAQ